MKLLAFLSCRLPHFQLVLLSTFIAQQGLYFKVNLNLCYENFETIRKLIFEHRKRHIRSFTGFVRFYLTVSHPCIIQSQYITDKWLKDSKTFSKFSLRYFYLKYFILSVLFAVLKTLLKNACTL